MIGRRGATAPFGVFANLAEYDADRDSWLLHRPERRWPNPVEGGPVMVPAVPEDREDSGGNWVTYLPMLGSLGIVAFAFVARSLVYVVVAAVMVVALVGGVVGARAVTRRRDAARRRRAQADWIGRLAAAQREAAAAAATQRDGLLGCYPDTAGLLAQVREHGAVWERRTDHDDFGHVRLGLGAVTARRPLVVAAGSDAPGVVVDARLRRRADDAAATYATVDDCPVVVPLRQLASIACVGSRDRTRDLAGAWVAALAATCAPTDLRIAVATTPDALAPWEWAKWLPHLRDPLAGDGFGRAMRAVVTSPAELLEVVRAVVEPRLQQRRRAQETGWHASSSAAVPGEHVVLVVDGYDPLALTRDPRLQTLLEQGTELAATVVFLVDDESAVPSSCDVVVTIDGDLARYRTRGPEPTLVSGVRVDAIDRAAGEQLARTLAPLQLAGADAAADLVDTVRLTELLGYESASSISPEDDWLTIADLVGGAVDDGAEVRRGPRDLLAAPIGVRSDGTVLTLDLKEAAAGGMGPHGVLVGATGYGKSELLRSLVTGLAARHSPELLNVILVDFKGGLAFADLEPLPHTSGVITNLANDLSRADRMRVSIDGERERRQQLLRDVGVASIRDYHEKLADGGDFPPLPYLVLIVDEFGELLEARPEFLGTFDAIGRLGRSLGMHLLLATQRLDEGRIRGIESHLRYRLCLRTNTAMESTTVLGVPDAYELPPLPGLGYLRADNELIRMKAATSSLPARAVVRSGPSPAVIRPFRLGHEVADVTGEVQATEQATGRPEIEVLVEQLKEAAPRARQIWLPELPSALDLIDVPIPDVEPERLVLALGRLDDPARQTQEPLIVDLSGTGGHLACVGGPRTGKTTFLRTLTAALTAFRSPGDVSLYVLDLSGGGLHDLARVPHVGAVANPHDTQAVARLLREIHAIVAERSAAFRELNVTTMAELRAHPRGAELLPPPLAGDVFLLVDGIGLLRNEFPELDLELAGLATTSLQFGVHVAVTANRWVDIRPSLLDAVGTRLELHLNDPGDSIAGRSAAAALPEDTSGRGLLRDGRQFQLALPPVLDPDAAARAWPGFAAPRVIPLPARVEPGDVAALAAAAGRGTVEGDGFVLGVAEFRLAPVYYDPIAAGQHLLVYGDGGSGRTTLLSRLVRHLLSRDDDVRLHLIDLGGSLLRYADDERVEHYAFTGSLVTTLVEDLRATLYDRLPPPTLTRQQLFDRNWWSGPEHVLVIDDYELLQPSLLTPTAPLAEALPYARDIGLHVVLARHVAGSTRMSGEPLGQRLRELTPTALLMSGDRGEGPLVGDRMASRQPPGRGLLVRRGQPDTLVQTLYEDGAG
ncbi:MAG: segregation ATPase FtsK/SpoIIIE, family [Frankiaceae bacterium]|nr:segregation ATPase FtsK/SpoIIIE, family [Frankiaceae bacterium]